MTRRERKWEKWLEKENENEEMYSENEEKMKLWRRSNDIKYYYCINVLCLMAIIIHILVMKWQKIILIQTNVKYINIQQWYNVSSIMRNDENIWKKICLRYDVIRRKPIMAYINNET